MDNNILSEVIRINKSLHDKGVGFIIGVSAYSDGTNGIREYDEAYALLVSLDDGKTFQYVGTFSHQGFISSVISALNHAIKHEDSHKTTLKMIERVRAYEGMEYGFIEHPFKF